MHFNKRYEYSSSSITIILSTLGYGDRLQALARQVPKRKYSILTAGVLRMHTNDAVKEALLIAAANCTINTYLMANELFIYFTFTLILAIYLME
jgi:hypothetical protein